MSHTHVCTHVYMQRVQLTYWHVTSASFKARRQLVKPEAVCKAWLFVLTWSCRQQVARWGRPTVAAQGHVAGVCAMDFIFGCVELFATIKFVFRLLIKIFTMCLMGKKVNERLLNSHGLVSEIFYLIFSWQWHSSTSFLPELFCWDFIKTIIRDRNKDLICSPYQINYEKLFCIYYMKSKV